MYLYDHIANYIELTLPFSKNTPTGGMMIEQQSLHESHKQSHILNTNYTVTLVECSDD